MKKQFTIKLSVIAVSLIAVTLLSVSCKKEIQTNESSAKTEQEIAMQKAKATFVNSKWQLEKAIISEPKDDYYLQRSLDFNPLLIELNDLQQAVITFNNQKSIAGAFEYSLPYNFTQTSPSVFFSYQFAKPTNQSLTGDEVKYLLSVAGNISYSKDGQYFSLSNSFNRTEFLFKKVK